MAGLLPTARCERRVLSPVAADPLAEMWRGLPIYALRETVTGAAPQQKTAVKLAHDGRELRVLFEITDRHVWATQTRRDGPIWEEEVVEMFLDPDGDLASYFEIEINPLNTVLDLVARKNRSGYTTDHSWDCAGLRSAVSKNAQGWCAELALPFSSLAAVAPAAGVRWRGNFFRIDRPEGAPRELTAWSPTGRANFHTPEKFGFLEFA